MASAITVRRLDRRREADFLALHGAPGLDWCYCAAWAVPTWEGWGERSAGANRAVREAQFAAGRHDGYLMYDGERPIGWCQCAPVDWFPKLAAAVAWHRGPAGEVPPHAVGCCLLLPAYRGRGLAHALLAAVLADLEARGVRRVLAYPRVGRHADGEIWTGPEGVFQQAGFRGQATGGPSSGDRTVMVKELGGKRDKERGGERGRERGGEGGSGR